MRPVVTDTQQRLDVWATQLPVYGAAVDLLRVFREMQAGRQPDFSESEKLQLTSLRNPKRKASRIAGRLAARKALSKYLHNRKQNSCSFEILSAPSGKPYIACRPDLHLSISHSGSLAVAVVSKMPVGVDIEREEPRPESFMRRFFSTPEYAWINERPVYQAARVNRLWTRKEAVAKLLGVGGKTDLSQLFVLNPNADFKFRTTSIGCYAVSLALHRDGRNE